MAKKKHTKSGLTGMNALISCISTTLMLLLLGLVTFFISFAHNFSNNLRENFNITILLDDEMTQAESYAFQTKLKTLPAARMVRYISKERALREQAEALQQDSVEFKDINPMPASFEISLKAEYANKDSLKRILPELEKYPKVMEVSYPQNLMDSLNSNIRKISSIMLMLALLLTLVSFVNINNTIRLSVFSRRFLIHTMKLVGANWSFIRKPFLIQALMIGLISAALASGILFGCIYAITQYEPNMIKLITWDVAAYTVGVIFICGIMLTLICAYFTINKTLRMRTEQLYRY